MCIEVHPVIYFGVLAGKKKDNLKTKYVQGLQSNTPAFRVLC